MRGVSIFALSTLVFSNFPVLTSDAHAQTAPILIEVITPISVTAGPGAVAFDVDGTPFGLTTGEWLSSDVTRIVTPENGWVELRFVDGTVAAFGESTDADVEAFIAPFDLTLVNDGSEMLVAGVLDGEILFAELIDLKEMRIVGPGRANKQSYSELINDRMRTMGVPPSLMAIAGAVLSLRFSTTLDGGNAGIGTGTGDPTGTGIAPSTTSQTQGPNAPTGVAQSQPGGSDPSAPGTAGATPETGTAGPSATTQQPASQSGSPGSPGGPASTPPLVYTVAVNGGPSRPGMFIPGGSIPPLPSDSYRELANRVIDGPVGTAGPAGQSGTGSPGEVAIPLSLPEELAAYSLPLPISVSATVTGGSARMAPGIVNPLSRHSLSSGGATVTQTVNGVQLTDQTGSEATVTDGPSTHDSVSGSTFGVDPISQQLGVFAPQQVDNRGVALGIRSSLSPLQTQLGAPTDFPPIGIGRSGPPSGQFPLGDRVRSWLASGPSRAGFENQERMQPQIRGGDGAPSDFSQRPFPLQAVSGTGFTRTVVPPSSDELLLREEEERATNEALRDLLRNQGDDEDDDDDDD